MKVIGVRVAAALVAAVAAWLSWGNLALTSAAPDAARLGLLPPLWLLGLLILAAVILVTLPRLDPKSCWPLFLSAAVVLPWLPLPVPAACLMWTGPLVAWIWVGVGVALAAPHFRAPGQGLRRWVGDPARGAVAAGAVAFVLYGAAAWQLSSLLPGGDAPHYLIITQSLLEDHDLQIENNHERGDYRAYFKGELRPDYLRRGRNGQIYSIHAPGLPFIIAPAFALAGYHGVMAFLCLVAALGAAVVWWAARRVTGSASAAWVGWASVALSAPFFLHAFMVYPEATGGTLIMVGVAALAAAATPRAGTAAGAGAWLLLGLALAPLPWLHTRYAVAAVLVAACLIVRLLRQRKPAARLAAFLALPAISAAAWFAFFYMIYGSFSPTAPYGAYTQTSLAAIPRALPAIVFDQQFGIVPNAPVYALAILGAAAMLARTRRLGLELLLVVVLYLCAVATYHMWWGGWSAPARFAVPVLLPLGIPVAVLWAREGRVGRAVCLVALTASLIITATLVVADGGRLMYNDRDGFARWLEWVSPLVDLPRGLPSFLRVGTGAGLRDTALWAIVLGATWVVLEAAERRRVPGAAAAGLLVPASLLVAVMLSVSLVWAAGGARPTTATTAQMALLRGYRDTPLALRYRPLGFSRAADALRDVRVSASSRRPQSADAPVFRMPAMPAGTYRFDTSQLPGRGALNLSIGEGPLPVERWILGSSAADGGLVFRLPVEVDGVVVEGEGAARQSADRLTLAALSVDPGVGAGGTRVHVAARYGPAIVYVLDGSAYPERPGFWVEGHANARVVVAPDGRPASVQLFVRNAPVPNHVTIESRRWRVTLDLQPREERAVDVPIDRATAAALVTIHPDRGFRPADADPTGRDYRYLGCWVEIR